MSDGNRTAAALRLAAVDPDQVQPGVLGLLVVLALVVATGLLLRSFTKHLGRVDFDESPSRDDTAIDSGSTGFDRHRAGEASGDVARDQERNGGR